MPMKVPSRLVLFCLLLSLKPVMAQQNPESTAEQTLQDAKDAFASGRPDYLLAQRAIEQAEQTQDLRLRAEAYLLQARLDSAGRRYSRAIPNYVLSQELLKQANATDAAAALAEAKAQVSAAEQARAAALDSARQSTATLEAERSSARYKYLALLGICLAVLAAGALAYLAMMRKLSGDAASARASKDEFQEKLTKAEQRLGETAITDLQRLRRIFQSIDIRISTIRSAKQELKLIAAQNAASGYLLQSSFNQGGDHEVAMEAFIAKLTPKVKELLPLKPGTDLKATSMPLRLPVDQATAVGLIYLELLANAILHGGEQIQTSLSKEGSMVSLIVKDSGKQSLENLEKGAGLKLVSFLAEELNAQVDAPEPGSLRIRFESASQRGTMAPIA